MKRSCCRAGAPALLAAVLLAGTAALHAAPASGDAPVRQIGSRLELFVDDFLIAAVDDGVKLRQHQPKPEEVVLSDREAWERLFGGFAVLRGADRRFHLYYNAAFREYEVKDRPAGPICLAVSDDGIRWEKPELKLFHYQGGDANNIVIGGDFLAMEPTANFRGKLPGKTFFADGLVPFVDAAAPAGQRYRALLRGTRQGEKASALYVASSPDGIHWSVDDTPLFTRGTLSAQNTVIYDAGNRRYAAFLSDTRGYRDDRRFRGILARDFRVSFSEDFKTWTEPVFVDYTDEYLFQIYMNNVVAYERAPHLLIGFPTIYLPNNILHGEKGRLEPLFMASRDGGRSWHRWPLALIARRSKRESDRFFGNMLAQGLIQANEREMYCYSTEGYDSGPSRRLRRFVWRTDGFVSLGGKGTALTHPLQVEGSVLTLNYRGKVKVEVLARSGKVIASRAFAGDEVAAAMPVPGISGPVRLRLAFDGGELFSFRFGGR